MSDVTTNLGRGGALEYNSTGERLYQQVYYLVIVKAADSKKPSPF